MTVRVRSHNGGLIRRSAAYAGMAGGVFALPIAESCHGKGPWPLWGLITRANRGGRLPGITLTLDGPSACRNCTTTEGVGFYVFSTLGNGAYTLTPSAAGCTFSPPSQDVTLTNNNPSVWWSATCP
jgi:hypothetical protein